MCRIETITDQYINNNHPLWGFLDAIAPEAKKRRSPRSSPNLSDPAPHYRACGFEVLLCLSCISPLCSNSSVVQLSSSIKYPLPLCKDVFEHFTQPSLSATSAHPRSSDHPRPQLPSAPSPSPDIAAPTRLCSSSTVGGKVHRLAGDMSLLGDPTVS